MMTRGVIGRRVCLAGLLAGLVLSPGVLAASTARAQDSGPLAPVRALIAGLDQIRKAGRSTPFDQRMATMTPVVQHAFALDTILKASVGPRFANIPPAEQVSLLDVFTRYTVASYVANFDTDSGDKFEINPETRSVDSDQIVTTRIVPAAGAATRLDYVVRQGTSGGSLWQIVDVLFDGSISQVAVQRSDFRSLLSGGSAGPLIASLGKKVATLAAGGKA
jgi:phospholipid transport system substrate-binding protein